MGSSILQTSSKGAGVLHLGDLGSVPEIGPVADTVEESLGSKIAATGANGILLRQVYAMPAPRPEIPSEKELSQLSLEANVAFAARCAIRVFLLIGSEGHFKFWQDDAEKNLQAVWAAALAAALSGSSGSAAAAKSANSAAKAAVAAYAYAYAYAAADAAYAAAYPTAYPAARAAAAKAAYPAARAAAAAARAAVDTAVDTAAFVLAMRNDFEWLKQNATQGSDWSFFERPLFDGQSVSLEQVQDANVIEAFKTIQSGDEILELWSQFFYGSPSEKAMQSWLNRWMDRAPPSEVIEQGEKAGSGKTASSSGAEESLIGQNEAPDEPQTDTKEVYRAPGAAATAADRPTTEDALNRGDLIKNLANMLSMPEQGTPITIGLFGDWGSGKSSVMQLLQKELSDEASRAKYPDFEFLFGWFNVWEYEHTKDIRAGLAQEVVNGLLSDGSFEPEKPCLTKPVGYFHRLSIQLRYLFSDASRDETRRWLLKLFGASGLLFFGYLGLKYLGSDLAIDETILGTGLVGVGFVFAYQLFKQAKVLWEHPLATELATFFKLPSFRQELGQIPVMRKQLEGLCKVRLFEKIPNRKPMTNREKLWAYQEMRWQIVRDKVYSFLSRSKKPSTARYVERKRLVLFVDDLDRCHFENIAKAFDAIRLITDIEGVIVIVGVDERIAFKAMSETYKDYADDRSKRSKEDVARDYLGKIIQIPIQLEAPRTASMDSFIQNDLFPVSQRKAEDRRPVELPPEPSAASSDQRSPAVEGERDEAADIDQIMPTVEDKEAPTAPVAEGDAKPGRTVVEESDPDLKKEQEKEWAASQRALMAETDAEVAGFTEIARFFAIKNPRQLIRLRNTYRLLKAMDPSRPIPEHLRDELQIPRVKFPELRDALLWMLFWLEYELQVSSDDLEKFKSKLEDHSQSLEASRKTELEKDFWPQVMSGFEQTEWRNLKNFTMTCLLPYPNKEAVSKKNAQAAEDTND